MTPRRVAIVGAGIAGLHAGELLQAQGFSVRLFDKARAPAGRVSTRRLDYGGFDHGAQYFTARDPDFEARAEEWTKRGVVALWQARVVSLCRGHAESAASSPRRWVGVPSMSAIARDLARGLEVETEVRIAATRRVDAGWVLIADDGFEIAGFDWLISAVPAPQAVALLSDSAELARQAQAVAFRACHAVMIALDAPLECGFDAAFVRDSPLGWLARQASKPGREPSNNWLLHSTSEWSESHLDLPADRIVERLHAALSDAVGGRVPAVRAGSVHRWLFARPAQPLAGEVLWDERLGLGVCGDWLQGDRIEDAYLSADRLVRAMLGSDSRSE